LVTLSLRVYAQAAEATTSHFPTHRGDHEVDVIVERSDRRVVAFETRVATVVDDTDVEQLLRLRERLGTHPAAEPHDQNLVTAAHRCVDARPCAHVCGRRWLVLPPFGDGRCFRLFDLRRGAYDANVCSIP